MGPSVREGDIVTLGTDLMERLCPGPRSGGIYPIFELVKRCWVISVERSGKYEEVAAGGKFRSDLIQRCGVDASRFPAVGLGLGLERLSMIRYGIEGIRAVQSAK